MQPPRRTFAASAQQWAAQPRLKTKSASASAIPDLSEIPASRIRNFAIIAHIDSGKSTCADRMLELTGTIPYASAASAAAAAASSGAVDAATFNAQVLDTLKVERERGITVRAQSCSMFYTPDKGSGAQESYLLNLIDTPGHVDFSSELLRSLLPSQGALLIVDGTQGVQAQTLSVLSEARSRGLVVIGAVNKWDLVKDDDRGPSAVLELAELLDCSPDDIITFSAKTGMNVDKILQRIVDAVPPPPPPVNAATDESRPLRALAFDSWHDPFRGVISLLAIADGSLQKGDSITSTTTGRAYNVVDVGLMSPREVSIADHPNPASRSLTRGQVGWVACNMKNVADAHLGDTFHHTSAPCPPLESFKPLKPMVFAGVYPAEPGGFTQLEESIRRLTLTDRSVTIQREASAFLGQGFRLGFNGSLHLDIFRQRLDDEYEEEIIVTRPLVPIKLVYKDGREKTLTNPSEFPEPAEIRELADLQEPMIKATIVMPDEFTGPVIELCETSRGTQLSHGYLGTPGQSRPRVALVYSLPLASIITNFHSQLKALTSGFASFDYDEAPYESSDLVRINMLVNGHRVDALCSVVHRSQMERESREWARRLREAIPRQQYEIVIQAAAGNKIIARERLSPVRKDVTAGLYGGHYERKAKHLQKQKEGKRRLKERSIGRVSIPNDAFLSVLSG